MPNKHRSLFLFCLTAILVLVGLAPDIPAQDVKIQRLGGGRYMTESVREVPGGGIRLLRINGPENLGGSIVVTTTANTTARLELRKIFKVESESEAADFERDIHYELTSTGSALELQVRTRSGASWEASEQAARVEITLTIPRDWDLEIRGRFFEMDLAGPFRDVNIETEYGRIKLSNVTQKTRVVGSYTGIEMSDIKGDIVAQTSFADLVLRNAIPSAERPARLTDPNGSIVVEKLAGAVIAESENAPIFLSDVVLLGVGSSLRSANGLVKADLSEFGNAELDIQNSNGSVVLRIPKTVSARLNCSVGVGGSIQTGGFDIQTHPDLLNVDRLEGIIGTGKGLIDIDVSGPGHIGIQGF